jgi:hypothetical protein
MAPLIKALESWKEDPPKDLEAAMYDMLAEMLKNAKAR